MINIVLYQPEIAGNTGNKNFCYSVIIGGKYEI